MHLDPIGSKQNQRESYYEVAIKADSADADIERATALQTTFDVGLPSEHHRIRSQLALFFGRFRTPV